MTTTIETKVNGVDVAQLNENIEVMKNDPEMAQFEFRSNNTWVDK